MTTIAGKPVRGMLIAVPLCLITAAAAFAQGDENQRIDRIVAVAEEDIVLQSELDRALAGAQQQMRARGEMLSEDTALKQQVLEQLIVKKLQLQRAQGTGIRASDSEVDEAARRIARQNNLSLDELRQRIEARGDSYAEFRESLREQLIVRRLRERVIEQEVDVTETDVDIELASEGPGSGEYRLSHVLISVSQGAEPEEVAEAKEKARDVYTKIQDGMAFDKAAIRHSDAQNALEGGDLGWRPSDEVPTRFVERVSELEVGAMTEPFRSPSGFHIVKLVDRREAAKHTVDEVKCRHIIVETSELVSEQDAREAILKVKDKLSQGGKFSELANEYSDDIATAELGGDMGWFPPQAYGQRYAEVLGRLEPGEVSEPFKTGAGWHLIKLEDRRRRDRTEEVLRQQARQAIRQRRAEQALQLWLKRMRDNAFVDIRVDELKS